MPSGEPVRLTRHAADEHTPAFSPDGTRIAFRSERDGGGVYVMPALGGEPGLLAAGGFEPRFSPDAQWISYNTGIKGVTDSGGGLWFASARLFIVPPAGGQSRRIQPLAKTATAAAWSPDSSQLLILASFETGMEEDDWWITPLEGTATKVTLGPLMQRGLDLEAPIAWLPGNRIVFRARSGDSVNYWTVTLSSRDWQISDAAQRLTYGAGVEGPASVSAAGGSLRLAFLSVVKTIDLWSVPLSRDGTQASAAPVRLTQDAAEDLHPTLTADGRTLIYSSDRRRKFELWARDLVAGRDTPLVSPPAPRNPLLKPVISMDGSKLAFWRLEGGGLPSATFVSELSRARDGSLGAGQPRELPRVATEGSGWPWSLSSEGSSLWYDPARWPRLAPNHLYDPAREERLAEFGHPQHDLSFLHFSPDGRSLAFMEPLDENNARLLVTRVDTGGKPGPPRDWIEIATGDHSVGWHGWAPAGDILYYESNRDGAVCVWAQRLHRETMRPIGQPSAIHHAHSARLSIAGIGGNRRGFAATHDRVVFNMSEIISNIWMTQFGETRR